MRPFFLRLIKCVSGFRTVVMSVIENLKSIHETIDKACKAWDRLPCDVNLIAVSKRQSMQDIQAALDAGQRVFGENRVQEAQEHWAEIKASGKYPDLELHLIGPLQTNKVKDAVALFDVIQSVDREKLARKLGAEMAEQGKFLPCFIQVNIGEEEQKSGVLPQEFSDFVSFCRDDCGLDVRGAMCIPPVDEPSAMYFALLKKMAEEQGLVELSMGMSDDFEKAIALGATYIRVGTAVFGARAS